MVNRGGKLILSCANSWPGEGGDSDDWVRDFTCIGLLEVDLGGLGWKRGLIRIWGGLMQGAM